MSESKHTPGPWNVEFGEESGYDTLSGAYRITGSNGQLVTVVDCADYYDTIDDIHQRAPEPEANANLIAAAPEQNAALLEAPRPGLFATDEEFVDFYLVWYNGQRAAAIAKAEGRQP